MRRFFLKTAARLLALIVLVASFSGASFVYKYADKGVPVLMYHAFTKDAEVVRSNGFYVTEETFERQIIEILEGGYTPIFAKDLNKPLPEKPVVITIDDGYICNYNIAFPILKKHNVKATIFTIVSSQQWEFSGAFSWEQAREMIESGVVDIQSHGFDLHKGTGMETPPEKDAYTHQQELIKDSDRVNELFVKELGYVPTVLAYPYGRYDDTTISAYKDRFFFAFTTTTGYAEIPGGNPMALNRIMVTENTSIKYLLRIW